MSFPTVPTARGQIIPGIKPVVGGPGFSEPTPTFGGPGGFTFDPCALLTPGTTLWNICKGFGSPGDPPIVTLPIDQTPPSGGQCGPGFTWSALLQTCLSDSSGLPDIDPGSTSPAEQGASMHGMNGHADTIPRQREIRRRVCGKGMGVLGKDGWCHKKIANKDRMYPKPRKALGTPGELNALTTSKKFAKRLLAAEKGIKETARDLAKAGGIKLGGK